jgi:hypothetical protein
MDTESFEKILLEQRRINASKGGQRSEQYRCKCGFYTGRKYNYNRHKDKCRLTTQQQAMPQKPA